MHHLQVLPKRLQLGLQREACHSTINWATDFEQVENLSDWKLPHLRWHGFFGINLSNYTIQSDINKPTLSYSDQSLLIKLNCNAFNLSACEVRWLSNSVVSPTNLSGWGSLTSMPVTLSPSGLVACLLLSPRESQCFTWSYHLTWQGTDKSEGEPKRYTDLDFASDFCFAEDKF